MSFLCCETYEIVELSGCDTTINPRDDLLSDSDGVDMVHVQAVAKPRDTCRDLVELNALLTPIALLDVHGFGCGENKEGRKARRKFLQEHATSTRCCREGGTNNRMPVGYYTEGIKAVFLGGNKKQS